MVNHPNRSRYRYYRVCPRGFVNEVTYIRASGDEIAEIDRHFDGWIDREFDKGNTDAMCGWTTDKSAKVPGVAISWTEYKSGFR